MQIPPVIVRELREESRRPINARLRLLAAGAVFITLLGQWATGAINEGEGSELFCILNSVLCATIWLLVPFMTADCISRERREGTLGLLFLTPLSNTGIILGKVLTHALRAYGLLLAVFPLMLICFMLGGLSWMEAAAALCMNSTAIILALSAGLLASCRCEQWNRAMIASLLFAAALLFLYTLNLGLFAVYNVSADWRHLTSLEGLIDTQLYVGFGIHSSWAQIATLKSSGFLFLICAQSLGFAVVVGMVSVYVAGKRLQLIRRAEPISRRREKVEQVFWKPRFRRGAFRRKMNRLLDRNPIGWLQRHTTGSRVAGLAWLLAVIILESWLFAGDFQDVTFWSVQVAFLLLLSTAYVSAGSFLRERQTGALELILVTPLSVDQIIWGRLRGIWGQFALPSILLIGGFLYYQSLDLYGSWRYSVTETAFLTLLFPWAMITIPIIGLYASLQGRGFLSALLATVLIGAAGPFAIVLLLGILLGPEGFLGPFSLFMSGGPSMFLFGAAQVPFVAFAFIRLRRNLTDRKFSMPTS
jgi:ABC-type transport system involved in multi-copper enzyme maturation permease subunit